MMQPGAVGCIELPLVPNGVPIITTASIASRSARTHATQKIGFQADPLLATVAKVTQRERQRWRVAQGFPLLVSW